MRDDQAVGGVRRASAAELPEARQALEVVWTGPDPEAAVILRREPTFRPRRLAGVSPIAGTRRTLRHHEDGPRVRKLPGDPASLNGRSARCGESVRPGVGDGSHRRVQTVLASVWSSHRPSERAKPAVLETPIYVAYPWGPSNGLITHDGVSVTCSRPEISMTSPSWTLKVTLVAPRLGSLLSR